MNCTDLSILKITDGTTSVDLLDEHSGFLLQDWTPQVADFKDGGIFQNSPLATGRRLVAYRFGNVTETMAVRSRHVSADALIRDTQTLRRLLQKAADYWATDWQNTPVYVEARGKGESNTRYCLIQQGRLGTDGNPYAQPFMQPSGSSVFEEQPLIFERGHWLSEVPGTTASVSQSGSLEWSVSGWDAETTTPTGNVTAIAQVSGGDRDGRIWAGTDDTARLYYSDDNGASWVSHGTLGASLSDTVEQILCMTGVPENINVLVSGSAGGQGVWESVNGGDSFTRPLFGRDYFDVVQTQYTGWLQYCAGGGLILTRTVTGSTTQGLTIGTLDILGIAEVPETGDILYIEGDELHRVDFRVDGNTDVTEITHGSSTFECVIRLSSGRILAGMANGVMYKSDDLGITWSTVTTTLVNGAFSLTEGLDGIVYAGGLNRIYASYTSGETWILVSVDPSTTVYGIRTKADGEIYAGDSGQILVQEYQNATATIYHVTNGHPIAHVSHVKSYDNSGASYTDRFPNSSLPYPPWPVPTGSQDISYIGVSDEDGAFSFSSVVFNFTTPGIAGQIIIKYWDGSAWQLIPTSELRGFASDGLLSASGQFAWVWDIPSDWSVTTVDGVSGRWIQVQIFGNVTTSPEQGDMDIFIMRNAYVEVAASAVLGDLPALGQMKIEVSSNVNGTSSGEGYINRAIVGVRGVNRGSRFDAYLNASDQGNDPGVRVALGTDTTFVEDITYPTNRRATYSPASTGSWLDIVTWTLAGDLVEDYYGTFHAFLRARQSGGSAGDIVLRMVTSTGSGGIEITTVSKEFENTNDYQFIDFGRVTLPVSSLQNDDEAGDEAKIVIQANASSTTPDVYFTDLVLIPIDEWYGDFTDQQRNAVSPVTNRYYLDVDSATFPKRSVRALVRSVDGTNKIKNVFQPATNGEFILQANAQQRLWFFFARTAGAGSPNTWYSEPFAAAKITLSANQRYLGMRGDR